MFTKDEPLLIGKGWNIVQVPRVELGPQHQGCVITRYKVVSLVKCLAVYLIPNKLIVYCVYTSSKNWFQFIYQKIHKALNKLSDSDLEHHQT